MEKNQTVFSKVRKSFPLLFNIMLEILEQQEKEIKELSSLAKQDVQRKEGEGKEGGLSSRLHEQTGGQNGCASLFEKKPKNFQKRSHSL